jgi:hypothetical protein
VLSAGLREPVQLLLRQVTVFTADLAEERDPTGRVGRDATVPDGVVQDPGEDAVRSQHRRRRHGPFLMAATGEIRDPGLHLREADLPDSHFFAFGLSLEETLRRHEAREHRDVTPTMMSGWYHGWQPLPFARTYPAWRVEARQDLIE